MNSFRPPTKREFESSKSWGLLTSLDIHHCDPETIKDPKAIKKFTHELCKKIKVNRFGETQIVLFGSDPKVYGYSMVQLIETSLVSAHFAEESDSVYLDVFSCAYYDAKKLVSYAVTFFKGKTFQAHSILRGGKSISIKKNQKFTTRNIILQPKF